MKSNSTTPTLLPCFPAWLVCLAVACLGLTSQAAPFDAAPFGLPLPEGNGVMWEDPREIHKVVVHFAGAAPAPESVRLEYWGSRWPEQHLPKDREPGGGRCRLDGTGQLVHLRMARRRCRSQGWKAAALTFTFRPVNAKEFPKLEGLSAPTSDTR